MARDAAAIGQLSSTARPAAYIMPFPCHASQPSSKLEEARTRVAVKTAAVREGEVSLAMQPSRKAVVRAGPGMAEGSEKQESVVYADWEYATAPSRAHDNAGAGCLRRLGGFIGCDESIQIFGELA